MSIKLAVFDIDGTLAPTENCIPESISHTLQSIEDKGIRVVLISGRTASYLAGLARGMGIKKPLVAGENGGVIFDPIIFWERKLDVIPPEHVTKIRSIVLRDFGEIWFQPNQTMVTAAPKDRTRIEELYDSVKNLEVVIENNYKLNKYNDSVEIMPQKNSKGRALAVIKEVLAVEREEVIVFGNTLVDLPMNAEAHEFLIIGNTFNCNGIKNYACIEDAFSYFEKHYQS